MHSVADLLSSLSSRNVRISVRGDQLYIRADPGVLQEDDMSAIRNLKHQIVEIMRQQEILEAPMQSRPSGCEVPLPFFLSGAWRAAIANGGSSTRCYGLVMQVVGPLQLALLRECLKALVKRHESLRTRFAGAGGDPRMHVETNFNFDLEFVDLSSSPADAGDEQVMMSVEEFARQEVNVCQGPLFAAKLWRISPEKHVLILAMDHMITDNVSNGIVNEELWALYEQAARGWGPRLPEPPLQFGDYAVWENATRMAWFNRHAAYWRCKLGGAPRVEIPCDYESAEGNNIPGVWREIRFGDELRRELTAVAKRERTLLPLVVLTIHIAAMSRWCKENDLLVSTMSTGRHRPELQRVVGFLACPLWLRVKVEARGALLDLLRHVVHEFQAVQEHVDYGRVSGLFPECYTEVTFNWGQTPPPIVVQDLNVRPMRLLRVYADIPKFGCVYIDDPSGLTLHTKYRPGLISKQAMDRLEGDILHFATNVAR